MPDVFGEEKEPGRISAGAHGYAAFVRNNSAGCAAAAVVLFGVVLVLAFGASTVRSSKFLSHRTVLRDYSAESLTGGAGVGGVLDKKLSIRSLQEMQLAVCGFVPTALLPDGDPTAVKRKRKRGGRTTCSGGACRVAALVRQFGPPPSPPPLGERREGPVSLPGLPDLPLPAGFGGGRRPGAGAVAAPPSPLPVPVQSGPASSATPPSVPVSGGTTSPVGPTGAGFGPPSLNGPLAGIPRPSPKITAPGRCLPPPVPYITVDDCSVARGNSSAGIASCISGLQTSGRPVVPLEEILTRARKGNFPVFKRQDGINAAKGFAIATLITALVAPLMWLLMLYVFGTPSVLAFFGVGLICAVPVFITLLNVNRKLTSGAVHEVVTFAVRRSKVRGVTTNPLSVYIVRGPGLITREMVHISGALLVAVIGPLLVDAVMNPKDIALGITRVSRYVRF